MEVVLRIKNIYKEYPIEDLFEFIIISVLLLQQIWELTQTEFLSSAINMVSEDSRLENVLIFKDSR